MPSQSLSLADFVQYLGDFLERPELPDHIDDDLERDLGFDSLLKFELLLSIEDLGCEVPEEELPSIQTVRHAYDLYCALVVQT